MQEAIRHYVKVGEELVPFVFDESSMRYLRDLEGDLD